MAEYDISGVPSQHIDHVWPLVVEKLQHALDHTEGEMGIEYVYQQLKEAQMQLWVTVKDEQIKSAIVTEIVLFPNIKSCRFVAMGGEVNGDFSLIDETISKWANEHECDRTEIVGRRGWVRALKKHGYGEAYTHVTRALR